MELVSIIFSQMSSLPVTGSDGVTSSRLPADTASPRGPDFGLRSNHIGRYLWPSGVLWNDLCPGRARWVVIRSLFSIKEQIPWRRCSEITKPGIPYEMKQKRRYVDTNPLPSRLLSCRGKWSCRKSSLHSPRRRPSNTHGYPQPRRVTHSDWCALLCL